MVTNSEARREKRCTFSFQELTIGTGIVFDADPPMGVAMAEFSPSVDYDPVRHAHEYEGERHPNLIGSRLKVVSDTKELWLAFHLVDFSRTLGEDNSRQLSLFFTNWESYEAFFTPE